MDGDGVHVDVGDAAARVPPTSRCPLALLRRPNPRCGTDPSRAQLLEVDDMKRPLKEGRQGDARLGHDRYQVKPLPSSSSLPKPGPRQGRGLCLLLLSLIVHRHRHKEAVACVSKWNLCSYATFCSSNLRCTLYILMCLFIFFPSGPRDWNFECK